MICAVNGVAAGAGANVALACDLVFAARSASFLQAFARIGLIPDAGGTWTLPRLVGPARARGLTMLAEPLPAEKAEAWGLIWKVVDDDKLEAEVSAVADRLAGAPPTDLPSPSARWPNPPPTRSPNSSTSSAICSTWRVSRPTPRRASCLSREAPRRVHREKAHDRRRGRDRTRERGCHVGGRQGEPRARHEDREGGAGSRRAVHERRHRAWSTATALCHGGYIFMLADSAMAFACSSAASAPRADSARSPTSRRAPRHAPRCRGARASSRRAQRHLRRDGAIGGGRDHRRVPRPNADRYRAR